MEKISFALIASYTLLIPIGIGAFRYQKLNPVQKLGYQYLFVALIFQIISTVLNQMNQNNLPLIHIYSVVRFAFLSLIFKRLIKDSFISRVVFANIFFFLGFSLVNALVFQDIFSFNSNSLIVESILLIIYSVVYLFQILREMQIQFVERFYGFWLVSGILYYFAGNFFLFSLSNLLLESSFYSFSEYWHIHSVNLILFYLSFSVAFLLKRMTPSVLLR